MVIEDEWKHRRQFCNPRNSRCTPGWRSDFPLFLASATRKFSHLDRRSLMPFCAQRTKPDASFGQSRFHFWGHQDVRTLWCHPWPYFGRNSTRQSTRCLILGNSRSPSLSLDLHLRRDSCDRTLTLGRLYLRDHSPLGSLSRVP